MIDSLNTVLSDSNRMDNGELLEEKEIESMQYDSGRQMHRECLKRIAYALKNGNQMFLLKTLAYGEGLASSNNFMATKVKD